jgi:hypothetical protein
MLHSLQYDKKYINVLNNLFQLQSLVSSTVSFILLLVLYVFMLIHLPSVFVSAAT